MPMIRLFGVQRGISLQTFTSYETIFIDDGSNKLVPMEGGDLSDKFTILHKENGGVSSVRNYGLNYAQGQYVVFCYADDFYSTVLP